VSHSPADLLITGCTVLVHDDQERIGFEQDAAIVVRDGRVESVTSAADAVGLAAVERIDARGQVALPGLINCHTHAPMVALRGLAEDLPTEEWFNDVVWPVESNLTEKDVELGARLACAEMIRAGVTCFADHYFSMDTVAAVVTECGMRAHLGEAYFSSQGPQGREKSLEFALRHRGTADGRITTALAPHAPYTVTDADLAATAELALEHGLPVHIHAAENRDQTDTSLARHGITPIEVLDRAGLLATDLLIAHGTGIIDRDLPVLERASGRIGGRHRAPGLPQVRLAGHHSDPRPARHRHPGRARHGRRRLQQLPRRVGVDGAHVAGAEVDRGRSALADVPSSPAPRHPPECAGGRTR
jgi:5-methylthioadenosine/S-adenosylhomocysteine deaminase